MFMFLNKFLNYLFEFEGLVVLQIGWKTQYHAIVMLLHVIVCYNQLVILKKIYTFMYTEYLHMYL
jgi:hypothetical protein